MRRSTRNKQPITTSPDTTNNQNFEKVPTPTKETVEMEDSSSDSDIENYLQPISKINLNSKFFQIQKSPEIQSFESIEKDIFSGTNQLSDSESDNDDQSQEEKLTTSKLNFDQLHNYTKKLEEAKRLISKYEAKKKKKEKKVPLNDDISNLLALGEMQVDVPDKSETMNSSDFESCSEHEDWEEVKESVIKPSTSIGKDGIQITVALPDNMKKKKGVDLVASMKRRLNRIKKENQVLIHKVHLLCWIAHGNYVNKILNSESLLGLSLSLIPSQHCYPPERTDLTYLEQILNWYHKVMGLTEKSISKQWSLEKVLKLQLTRKLAYNKKMFTYIFICILRSLGIQCRLVLSFQVLPLRPPSSELHSLSTKLEAQNSESARKSKENIDKPKSDSPNKIESKNKNQTKTVQSEEENEKSKQIKDTERKSNDNAEDTKKIKSSQTKQVKNGEENEKPKQVKGKVRKSHDNAEGIKKIKLNQTKQVKSEEENEKPKQVKDKARKSNDNTEERKIIKLKEKQKSDTSKTKRNAKSTEKTVTTRSSKSLINKPKSEMKSNQVSKPVNTPSKKLLAQLDGTNDISDEEFEKFAKPNLKKLTEENKNKCSKNHLRRLKKVPNYEDQDSDSNEDRKEEKKRLVNLKSLKEKLGSRSSLSLPSKSRDVKSDVISIMKTRIKQEKAVARSKLVKSRKSKPQSDEDSDYAPEQISKKYDSDDDFHEDKVKVKKRIEVKRNSAELEKTKKGMDIWVEIYLEAEEKWISADVVKNRVHCVNQLYTRASHPVSYIVAWNNNNSIKDITQRYCTNWNTTTRKLRIDSKWWTATLKPFIGTKTVRDKEEDEELAQLQLDKPLPSTISEYKNHPLYVLKRHLLKFQALYPPDLPPLGFVRNEPVYARDCVHILHSREIWLKEAKTVKPNQQPYKVVKARPKYDKLSGKVVKGDIPLEVFGIWQVEDYDPPTAENGIVPRNAYGNVELFKACMLPKGTVHLQLPGLNKVAKKMNIDCVPAVVGFDFHSGWNHPTYDGFVVCEEHSESLVAAWFQEQEEQEKRDQEKIEKRVYGNWRKLIKGLLIRERLKQRYDYGESSQSDVTGKKRKTKAPKLLTKKRRICSDSESD